MSAERQETLPAEQEGIAHRDARRSDNELKAASTSTPTDAQGLVEFACECTRPECERLVKVPLYVYERMLGAGDQYLLQAGHHAFARYRTIVTIGLMRIEESV